MGWPVKEAEGVVAGGGGSHGGGYIEERECEGRREIFFFKTNNCLDWKKKLCKTDGEFRRFKSFLSENSNS